MSTLPRWRKASSLIGRLPMFDFRKCSSLKSQDGPTTLQPQHLHCHSSSRLLLPLLPSSLVDPGDWLHLQLSTNVQCTIWNRTFCKLSLFRGNSKVESRGVLVGTSQCLPDTFAAEESLLARRSPAELLLNFYLEWTRDKRLHQVLQLYICAHNDFDRRHTSF